MRKNGKGDLHIILKVLSDEIKNIYCRIPLNLYCWFRYSRHLQLNKRNVFNPGSNNVTCPLNVLAYVEAHRTEAGKSCILIYATILGNAFKVVDLRLSE